ncbi:hypothetical protein ANCCEY_09622 [Ancylostoma ceylanicum]|uniref:Solute carrier family 40 member n=1 Tax=Ancylostoma ceylanicum TaxID=53326 RepID=A0A0D6LH47_9BILA|nr:hypothetical protein ANCCEY_09622 [Ancylostoma ceylanicum]
MADLSIVHIMQEGVPESDRNTVFGVHNALCQTFSLLKHPVVKKQGETTDENEEEHKTRL